MKSTFLLLAVILAVQQLPAQMTDNIHDLPGTNHDISYAPLLLFTNGAGRIIPFQNEQMLRVGREYVMFAIPDRGFVFTNWNQVNVFTLTTAEIDYGTTPPVTNFVASNDLSSEPAYTRNPFLIFKMSPEQVLFETIETNGSSVTLNSLTLNVGWQANFVPLKRNMLH